MTKMEISRRKFIVASAAVGGGLMIGFNMSKANAAAVSNYPHMIPTDKEGVEVNAWLTIDPESIVTVRVPHTEQGQGALTSVPSMVAEELDIPWANIRAVFADANRHVNFGEEYVNMGTAGSNVVRSRHPHIMQAGASARERLKEAAAQAWGVARADVLAQQGLLTSGNNTGTYGEFASAAATVQLDAEPDIKDPSTWWFLGTPVNRLEIPHKVNGSAQYSIDTRLDNMCYASVKSCPVPWGELKSFNADAIKDRPGIIAVIELKSAPADVQGARGNNAQRSAIAVVADSWYRAKTALELMPIEWDYLGNEVVDNGVMMQRLTDAVNARGDAEEEIGANALELIAAAPADKVLEGTFFRPYETHARMEPINATVSVGPDRIDVWSPSQNQSLALTMAATTAGRDTKEVWPHTVFIGGAFGSGGGGAGHVTRQATQLSLEVGRPVKLIWTREEDISLDIQRQIQMAYFQAAIGDDGLPSAWFSRSTEDSAIVSMPYLVPNRRHEIAEFETHIPTGSHRAPGNNSSVFMIEQFVDEVALAGGWDPLDWRLKMTEGLPSWQLVLNTMKEKAGFRTDLPKGEGMGIAICEDHNSIAAACATITVSRRGQLTVERVQTFVDSGYYINPLNCAEQSEGAACWELTHAWIGGLDMRQGRFVNTNYDTYPMLRIAQMPPVELTLTPLGGEIWGGMGEPSGPPTPAAIANAIFFATGKRVRTTPFKNHDLSWS